MMPGPLLAVTIIESARRGFWAGPQLVLGHGILELALIAALAAGLSRFMENQLVPSVIGLVGGMVLVGMGLVIMKRGRKKVTIPTASSGTGGGRMLVISGVVVSIASPYWLIWWVTLGMTYLLWSLKLGIAGVASFFTGHILADLAWYTLVAFIIATGRKVMNDTVYRWLLFICGLALFSLGGYFIASGVRFLIA